ncbi:MAG: Verru_Chthon cassette protein B [Chthoniobacter sp.]
MFPPNSPPSRKIPAPRRQSGFSLVEVVLAVGVISFAFVAIMGLIPAGLQQFRQAIDNSVCAQIAQRIIQDAQLSDFATLTGGSTAPYIQAMNYAASDAKKSNPIPFRYFDEQGNEIVPKSSVPSASELAAIVYHVNTRIATATALPGSSSSAPNTSLATILVQVAFNPSGKPLKTSASGGPNSFLIDTTSFPGGTVRNYSAQIGRND